MADRKAPSTPQTFDFATTITTPILGSFGALDTGILPADVRAFEENLLGAHDIKIYENTKHAFFDDTRGAYKADSAADAWTRTLAWFKKYLSA